MVDETILVRVPLAGSGWIEESNLRFFYFNGVRVPQDLAVLWQPRTQVQVDGAAVWPQGPHWDHASSGYGVLRNRVCSRFGLLHLDMGCLGIESAASSGYGVLRLVNLAWVSAGLAGLDNKRPSWLRQQPSQLV